MRASTSATIVPVVNPEQGKRADGQMAGWGRRIVGKQVS
jgi:hypothetical protein